MSGLIVQYNLSDQLWATKLCLRGPLVYYNYYQFIKCFVIVYEIQHKYYIYILFYVKPLLWIIILEFR